MLSPYFYSSSFPLFKKEIPFGWRLIVALLLALALAPAVFSWPVMSGSSSAIAFPKGDQAACFAGAFYFYQDIWRFPLLNVRVPGIETPLNIVFTDSLPLLALPFKLWFKLTGQMVNYTVIWLWICVFGQAIGALLLLEHLQLRRIPETIAGIVLAIVMPSFLFRYWLWHLALCGQFVLIFGLVMYFRYDRPDRFAAVVAAWTALLVGALLIHPYIFAMEIPFFLLYGARKAALSQLGLRHAVALGLCVISVVMGIMLTFGYVTVGRSIMRPDSGFGWFSMNLLAPLGAMGKSGLLPDSGHFATGGSPGQVEGFNYFGLGLLLGTIPALFALVGRHGVAQRAALYRQWPLAAMALVLTAFAVSNRIYLGHYLVLDYTVPHFLENITGTFRSSGRFFWPVGYIVLAAVLMGIARGFKPHISGWIFLLMASLQWLDTSELRRVVVAEKPASAISADPTWQHLVATHPGIALYPPTQCLTVKPEILASYSEEFQMLAARYGRRINSIHSARSTTDCEKYQDFLLKSDLPHDTLVVLFPPYDWAFVENKGWARYCHQYGEFLYCALS
ncbi:DUF6311 domain-containing protein [Candidatus Methylocalor cossyra]|uniref:Glycosyltransferase RgtA/B/C/D-like domain-containing protein n=1 Tax=Candidatus Methylocalor cossyra TaxID=3108543 RepID=A0ABM9NN02_9GAMM